MKFFALILLFAAMLLVAAIEDEEMDKCGHCYDSEEEFVCARKDPVVGTFYNKCLVECMEAELLYEGECKNEDLKESRLEQK